MLKMLKNSSSRRCFSSLRLKMTGMKTNFYQILIPLKIWSGERNVYVIILQIPLNHYELLVCPSGTFRCTT